MDVLELLGALHQALRPGATLADTVAWRQALAVIRTEVEADPITDRYDRETLDVIERKLADLIATIEADDDEPDFKPAQTWVAALAAALYRRRSAKPAARPSAASKKLQ